ncbi:MAG: hypothetical protein ACRC62_13285 [Microcoleus sp.]
MCTNNEIDALLKQLAVAAKNLPPKTCERRQAMTALIKKIQESNLLRLPRNDKFSPQIYEEICAEAEHEFMLRICKEIHNYRPEKEVRQWVGFLLDKCFKTATNKVIGSAPIKKLGFRLDLPQNLAASSDRPKQYIKILHFGDMKKLENKWHQSKDYDSDDTWETGKALREMIEEDPGDVFKSEAMSRYPQVNFQMLLLKRGDDVGWREMSEEYGVKVSTLSSFFQRSLQKFQARFQEYL